jgi:homoserine kinase type II
MRPLRDIGSVIDYDVIMAVYTHLSQQELQAVCTYYALGELVNSTAISEGVENSNYLLECNRNECIQRYIFTIYEKRVDPNDLPFFLNLMGHLASRGIRSPRPLANKRGSFLHEVHGKPCAVTSFLEGKSVSNTRTTHLRHLGEGMAAMHRAVHDFSMLRTNNLSLPGWQELFEAVADDIDSIASGLKTRIEGELAYLDRHWPQEGLEQGVIHADLFPDNVFFQGTELSGFIDFYFACNDFFLYDVAVVLNAWCFERQKEFNVTKAAALLHGYNAVRQFDAAELEALPILCRGAALRFFLTRAYDWLNREEGALVTVKDPIEYWRKLQFHQQVKGHGEYGL